MKRREVLSKSLCAGMVGTVGTTRVRAQSSHTVQGTVSAATGTSIETNTIALAVGPEFNRARIGPEGSFEIEVDTAGQWDIIYYHGRSTDTLIGEHDGVPVIHLLGTVDVEGDMTDVGELLLPEANVLDVQFVDPDGDPISDLPLSFRVRGGYGAGPEVFTTDSEGYLVHPVEDTRGAEVAGPIQVEIHQRGNEPVRVERLGVTEDTEIESTLQNPEQYGATVVTDGEDSTETGASVDQEASEASDTNGEDEHRGFLTNDPDSPLSALNDPVALTWFGIVVSIVGIMAQLFMEQS